MQPCPDLRQLSLAMCATMVFSTSTALGVIWTESFETGAGRLDQTRGNGAVHFTWDAPAQSIDARFIRDGSTNERYALLQRTFNAHDSVLGFSVVLTPVSWNGTSQSHATGMMGFHNTAYPNYRNHLSVLFRHGGGSARTIHIRGNPADGSMTIDDGMTLPWDQQTYFIDAVMDGPNGLFSVAVYQGVDATGAFLGTLAAHFPPTIPLDFDLLGLSNTGDVSVMTELRMSIHELSLTVAGRIHVDDDAPLGGDGLTWNTAYKYLQDALAVAVPDEEIRVAGGIYKPDQDEAGNVTSGDRSATFQMLNNVVIQGGYRGLAGGGDPDDRDIVAFETTLSGDLAGDDGPGTFDNNGDNSYHVVTGSGMDETAIIDGFTISGGNANGPSSSLYRGGGIYNVGGSPSVSDCIIRGNNAQGGGFGPGGGGMYNSGGNPNVSSCTFVANHAYPYGGGMRNSYSDILLTNCSFIGNSAGISGGGIYNSHSNTIVLKSTFSGNLVASAAGTGGAVMNAQSTATLMSCVVSGNTVSSSGGAIANLDNTSMLLVNSLVIGNAECGIRAQRANGPTIINSILSGNTGYGLLCRGTTGGGSVSNCILWGNSGEVSLGYDSGGFPYSDLTVLYSDIQGGEAGVSVCVGCTLNWGDGNIDADPVLTGGPSGTWTSNGAYDQATGRVIFTDDTAFWQSDALVGKFVNPDTAQARQFVIIDNANTTITIWADWTTIDALASWVSSGASYDVRDYHLTGGSPCIDTGSNAAAVAFLDTTTAPGTAATILVADASLYAVDDETEYDNDGVQRTVTAVDVATNTVTFDDPLPAPSESGKAIKNYGLGDMDGEDRIQHCRVDMGADETPYFQDCNSNGTSDACEISAGTSPDCNANGIPDECEVPPIGPGPDCNANGIPDDCEVPPIGVGPDCNSNGIPDACEVPPLCPGCPDCNANGVPDECESDFDGDGIIDDCDDDDDNDGVLDVDDVCPYTPLGLLVDCEGRPRLDLNQDCNVDGLDMPIIVSQLLNQ